MIPIAIVLGFIGGSVSRVRWWPVPFVGVLWSIMLTIGGDSTMSLTQVWIAGFALGAVNAAVGVAIGRAVSKGRTDGSGANAR